MEASLKDAALSYAARGWAVFPLRARSKEPRTAHGVKDATRDAARIAQWWGDHPDDNIGLATGARSGGLVVIDVDVDADKGKDGRASMDAWEKAHGELPATACAKTGRGGAHLLYMAEGVRNTANAEKAIDVRGDGGYIVAPPSVHPNGNRYEWIAAPDAVGIAKADENVLALIADLKRKKRAAKSGAGGGEVKEGGRNDALYRKLCSLQSLGLPDDEIEVMAFAYNSEHLSPPLDDAEVRKTLESALSQPKGRNGGRSKFNHADFGDELIEQYRMCFVDGIPCMWLGGRYVPGMEGVNAAMVAKWREIKMRERKEVYGYLAITAPKREQADPRYIAFENCVLDLEDLRTLPLSPEYVIPNVIPHDWDEEAAAPVAFDTLDRMACHDDATYDALCEVIGLCMYRGREFGKAPILLGEGSNGKSTYIKVLQAVLGEGNYSGQNPHTIAERFQSRPLMGKLANIYDDMSNAPLTGDAAAMIKKIITGDSIDAEYKGGDQVVFRPYCSMVFAGNDMPRLGDASFGMMRRLHPIFFNARFGPDVAGYDPDIERKLMSEESLKTFCAMGVGALTAMRERKELTDTQAGRDAVEEFRRDNNGAVAWLYERYPEGVAYCATATLFQEYCDWCDESRIRPMARRTFTRIIQKETGTRNGVMRSPVTGEVMRAFLPRE